MDKLMSGSETININMKKGKKVQFYLITVKYIYSD